MAGTLQQSMLNTMQYRGAGAGAGADKPASAATTGQHNPELPFVAPDKSPTQLVNGFASADKAKAHANQLFSNIDKQYIAERAKDGGNAIRDGYTDADKRRAYKNYDANLGAGSPRGNINQLNNDNTLTMSRAADAYNNATRWQPGLAGRRTNSSFGSNEMQANNFYKDTIETQEMRQMRANERIDEQVRGYDAARQDRVDSHNMALQEKADELQFEMQQLLGRGDIDFGNAMRDMAMELEYGEVNRASIQKAVSRYLQAVALQDKTKIAKMAADIWNSDPTLAQYYSMILTGTPMPSAYERVVNQHAASVVNDLIAQGANPEDLVKSVGTITSGVGAAATVANVGAATEAAIEEASNGIRNTAVETVKGWFRR